MDYRLCVYDPAGVRFDLQISPGPNWVPAGSEGFTFTADGVGDSGITKIKLKAGGAGNAKLLVKGRGPDLGIDDTPASTLPLSLPVTVELQNLNGECWSATYSTASDHSATMFKSHQLAPSPTPTPTFAPTSTATVTATPTLQPKYVFVTEGAVVGDFGGLPGGDAYCQSEAFSAFLGNTYKAWLSDSTTSAASRLTHWAGQYQLVDGTKVADDWADLTDGTLDAPISLNPIGSPVASHNVWTGTLSTGLSSGTDCGGWTSSAGTGHIGDDTTSSGMWTQFSSLSCSANAANLYCIEQ